MSQQPPPGDPRRPQPPATGEQRTDSAGTPPAEPTTIETPAEAVPAAGPAATDAGPSISAETGAVAEEDTLEAQGVSPDSETATPAGSPEVHPSVASPLRGTPTAQAPAAPPVIAATPDGAQVVEPASATATRSSGATTDDIVYTPFALSVGDGFRLGCGIILAVFVAVMIVALIAAIGFLIASLVGVPLPIGMLGPQ